MNYSQKVFMKASTRSVILLLLAACALLGGVVPPLLRNSPRRIPQ
jgi:hypothetical protein